MIKLCICHSKSKTLLVQYVLLVSSSTTIQGNVHLIGQHTDSLSFFPRTTPEQNSLPQDVTTQLNSSFVETRACSTLNLSTSLACVNEKLVSELRKRRLDQELCRSGFIPGTVTEAGLVWPDTPKQLVNCIGTPIVQFPFSLQLMNSLSLSPTPFFCFHIICSALQPTKLLGHFAAYQRRTCTLFQEKATANDSEYDHEPYKQYNLPDDVSSNNELNQPVDDTDFLTANVDDLWCVIFKKNTDRRPS